MFDRAITTDFLNDDMSYNRAQQVWNELWENVAKVTDTWNATTPWLSDTYQNGSLRRDGNPVFSVLMPSKLKAIRIIQYPLQGDLDNMPLNCWLDYVGGGPESSDSIEELVISLALTQLTHLFAYTLMVSWVKGDVNVSYEGPNPTLQIADPTPQMLRLNEAV